MVDVSAEGSRGTPEEWMLEERQRTTEIIAAAQALGRVSTPEAAKISFNAGLDNQALGWRGSFEDQRYLMHAALDFRAARDAIEASMNPDGLS